MFTMTQVPTMLRIREAAETFNISAGTIRKAIQTEEIPAYHPNGRTYLVKAGDVLDWLERCKYSSRKGS